MRVRKADLPSLQFADIIARDKDGQIVLLVAVDARKIDGPTTIKERSVPRVPYLRTEEQGGAPVPFAMIVQLDLIWASRQEILPSRSMLPEPERLPDGSDPTGGVPASVIWSEPTVLKTPDVLSFYDHEFTEKQVFETYLITLVEAWLRDLAYHWKSEMPPGAAELTSIGLVERLKGGTAQAEGSFDDDPLY